MDNDLLSADVFSPDGDDFKELFPDVIDIPSRRERILSWLAGTNYSVVLWEHANWLGHGIGLRGSAGFYNVDNSPLKRKVSAIAVARRRLMRAESVNGGRDQFEGPEAWPNMGTTAIGNDELLKLWIESF